MNGISPPATIHRRLNNKELPIKKTGKIQEFWIFSAPPRATALIIRELRATRTAFCAVIRKGTPQRPTPCAPITYLFFCGICRPPTAVCTNAREKKSSVTITYRHATTPTACIYLAWASTNVTNINNHLWEPLTTNGKGVKSIATICAAFQFVLLSLSEFLPSLIFATIIDTRSLN